MPRLITDETMETGNIGGMQAFKFSGVRTEHLGATEYTVVTIAVDETGSIDGFEDDLRISLITAVEACKKSPRSDNLLLRVIKFSTSFPNGVEELHGFKPLAEINPQDDYPQFRPGGQTPLYDATFSAVGATNAYAKKLMDDDFLANGIVFVITDGANNASTTTPAMIKQEVDKAVKGEIIESLITVLIGINAQHYLSELKAFQSEAGIDQYIDAGEATKDKLAKLAEFVSQSVSSQSQSLGTGGPSQQIFATI
ncbi:hypothetical protein KKC67_01485 [Patescibacteria group bacterium]|nr:hypothetical protein [Patescibacteria group bacterium]MBU0879528.1 hypothetical protein [Patescibacteria group bacterium]MBU0880389.1 hypothetical protein [Patescibacteria group bacterium]MBU0897773.1 hypothetical protein [Patescibacteria group bacterium]MBU1783253.1 hypothetical protein [Patescibacteria group bacterium]